MLLVTGGNPTPTPTCLPSDTNCDGVVDNPDLDYDGDGYNDWYDPNPWSCDPCLKANKWTLEIWVNGQQQSDPYAVFPCDGNPIIDFEFWPTYYFEDGNGNSINSYSICLFNDCNNPAQWSISPGSETNQDWAMAIDYSDVNHHFMEAQFYTADTYQITVTQPSWNDCPPITETGCSNEVTSAPGGGDTVSVNVYVDPNEDYVTVSRNTNTSVSASQVDADFNNGYNNLSKDVDWFFEYGTQYDDVVCCLQLKREGSIFVINDPSLKYIDNLPELSAVLNNDKIVNYVSGFSYPDEDTLGVTPFGSYKFAAIVNELVVYHEYGHTKDLDDLATADWDDFLMRDSLSMAGWQTNSGQSAAITPF